MTPKQMVKMLDAQLMDALSNAKKLQAENKRLREILDEGVNLIKGDAVNAEWKQGCASFVRAARAELIKGDKP